jgi:hypothetical protein
MKETKTMSKEVRDGYHSALERAQVEIPEWLDYAREVIAKWESGKTLLLPVIANGLKEAYERGQRGEEIKRTPKEGDQVIRRTRPATGVEEVIKTGGPVRRTRHQTEEPPVPPPRTRRTRPGSV